MTDTKDKALTELSEAVRLAAKSTEPVLKAAVSDLAHQATLLMARGKLQEQRNRFAPKITEMQAPQQAIACTLTLAEIDAIIDRLTTPPAPQAGEIEQKLQYVLSLLADRKVPRQNIATHIRDLAALRSAQAPARTYADGIEDAAKCAEMFASTSPAMPEYDNGYGNARRDAAKAIRALSTKPAGKES